MNQSLPNEAREHAQQAGRAAALRKDLASTLAGFARVRLGHLPTPLEPMDRLSEALGGPRFWVKRDDCTGLSSGGNKTRKLEFLMAEAIAGGADTVITQIRSPGPQGRHSILGRPTCHPRWCLGPQIAPWHTRQFLSRDLTIAIRI